MNDNQVLDTVDNWGLWYFYREEYGHLFATPLGIPVPDAVINILERDGAAGRPLIVAIARRLNAEGRLQYCSAPPDGPPSASLVSRATTQGQASKTIGEAAARGAWEGVKSSGAGSAIVRTLLSAIFRR